jgi:hypothetical protein
LKKLALERKSIQNEQLSKRIRSSSNSASNQTDAKAEFEQKIESSNPVDIEKENVLQAQNDENSSSQLLTVEPPVDLQPDQKDTVSNATKASPEKTKNPDVLNFCDPSEKVPTMDTHKSVKKLMSNYEAIFSCGSTECLDKVRMKKYNPQKASQINANQSLMPHKPVKIVSESPNKNANEPITSQQQQTNRKSKSVDFSTFIGDKDDFDGNSSSLERDFNETLNIIPVLVVDPDPKTTSDFKHAGSIKAIKHGFLNNLTIHDNENSQNVEDGSTRNYYDTSSLDKFALRHQISRWNDLFSNSIPETDKQNLSTIVDKENKKKKQRFPKKKPAPRSHSVDEQSKSSAQQPQQEYLIDPGPKSILKNPSQPRQYLKRQDAVAKSFSTDLNRLHLKNCESGKTKILHSSTATTTTASSQSSIATTTSDEADNQTKSTRHNRKDHREACRCQTKRNYSTGRKPNIARLNLSTFTIASPKLSPLTEHQNYSSDDSVCGIPKSRIK